MRGHFRKSAWDGLIIPSLSTSLWRSEVLRRYPLEERIRYGYEDADLALRMATDGVLHVRVVPEPSVDRGAGRTILDAGDTLQELVDSARAFVAVRRYWNDRPALLKFLVVEAAANVSRRRRPLPRSEVPGQWQDTARHLVYPRSRSLTVWN
jgi:hypothetical protein